jgi:methylase of polypeptide subunit release factors
LAADSAARCGAEVEFRESSLFSSVTGHYDIIVFNAPYIEAQVGRRLGALRSEFDETRWSGGETGVETIERFLEGAPAHLSPRGLVLLGVNHFYLAPARLEQAIQSRNLKVLATLKNRVLRACVYVLRPQCPVA